MNWFVLIDKLTINYKFINNFKITNIKSKHHSSDSNIIFDKLLIKIEVVFKVIIFNFAIMHLIIKFNFKKC